MMLLAVLSPVLRCEWQLDHYHVAFLTTVSLTQDLIVMLCVMVDCYRIVINMPGLKKKPAISQVVFIGMCLLAPVWGFIGDKYGRQTVSAIIY